MAPAIWATVHGLALWPGVPHYRLEFNNKDRLGTPVRVPCLSPSRRRAPGPQPHPSSTYPASTSARPRLQGGCLRGGAAPAPVVVSELVQRGWGAEPSFAAQTHEPCSAYPSRQLIRRTSSTGCLRRAAAMIDCHGSPVRVLLGFCHVFHSPAEGPAPAPGQPGPRYARQRPLPLRSCRPILDACQAGLCPKLRPVREATCHRTVLRALTAQLNSQAVALPAAWPRCRDHSRYGASRTGWPGGGTDTALGCTQFITGLPI